MAKKIINYKGKCKTAFTLIELLVVIAIIALLLSILMPALTAVKKQARAVMCSSNLKQVYLLHSTYMQDHDDYIVPVTSIPSETMYWINALSIQNTVKLWYEISPYLYCPSRPQGHKYEALYGMNVHSFSYPVKFSKVRHPGRTILNADTINQYEAVPFDINMWAYKLKAADLVNIHGSPVWFRHKEKANILFTDGHAESRVEEDVDKTGGSIEWQYWAP